MRKYQTSTYVGRFAARLNILLKTVHECLSSTLGKVEPRTESGISRLYDLTIAASVNLFILARSCLKFGHDMLFLRSNRCCAETWHDIPPCGTEASYMYYFHCLNPCEGNGKAQLVTFHIQFQLIPIDQPRARSDPICTRNMRLRVQRSTLAYHRKAWEKN